MIRGRQYPAARYRVASRSGNPGESSEARTETVCGGDQLMYAGLPIPRLEGDYASCVWHLTRV